MWIHPSPPHLYCLAPVILKKWSSFAAIAGPSLPPRRPSPLPHRGEGEEAEKVPDSVRHHQPESASVPPLSSHLLCEGEGKEAEKVSDLVCRRLASRSEPLASSFGRGGQKLPPLGSSEMAAIVAAKEL